MKFTVVAFAVATATMANAQVVFNSTTNTFSCFGDAAGKNFCAGDSLATNIIIRCTGTQGQPGNCNDNLAGVPPVGVKTFAPCYQTSNTTGDAVCSFNGIGYPDSGQPFPIPGASSSSVISSATSTSSSSVISSTTSSSETLVPYTSTSLTTSASVYPVTTTIVTSLPVTLTTSTAAGTGGPTTVPGNGTVVTTGLPVPTPTGSSGAEVIAYQRGIFVGAAVLVAAALL